MTAVILETVYSGSGQEEALICSLRTWIILLYSSGESVERISDGLVTIKSLSLPALYTGRQAGLAVVQQKVCCSLDD